MLRILATTAAVVAFLPMSIGVVTSLPEAPSAAALSLWCQLFPNLPGCKK